MASLFRPVPPCPIPGVVPTLRCPSHPLLVVLPPLLARAAAANVNPRTRLSHVTEIPPLLGS